MIFSLAQPRVEACTSPFLTCSAMYHVQVGNYFGSSRYEVVLNHLASVSMMYMGN